MAKPTFGEKQLIVAGLIAIFGIFCSKLLDWAYVSQPTSTEVLFVTILCLFGAFSLYAAISYTISSDANNFRYRKHYIIIIISIAALVILLLLFGTPYFEGFIRLN